MDTGGAAFRWLVGPALAMLALFYLWPLAQVVWISVSEPHPGLDNYALLLTSASIGRVLRTTVRICVITTIVTLVLGYLVAYVLTHARPAVQRLLLAGCCRCWCPSWCARLPGSRCCGGRGW